MSVRRPMADIGQISDYTGTPQETIYYQRSQGVGLGALAIKIGRHLRWRWEDVDRWLDEQQASRGA